MNTPPDDYVRPQAIPVIHRLPRPYDPSRAGTLQDCDPLGRCWWFHRGTPEWELQPIKPQPLFSSHWAPYWALPLP